MTRVPAIPVVIMGLPIVRSDKPVKFIPVQNLPWEHEPGKFKRASLVMDISSLFSG